MRQGKIIQTALSGSGGRMGQSLQQLIKKSPRFALTEKARRSSCFSKWDSKKVDGLIDFSAPELFSASLAWAAQNKKAFVSGTTGLKERQKREMKRASKKIPIFYSENMSAGICFLRGLLPSLSCFDADILLEDFHHKDKKDKPSGTALRLKRALPGLFQKRLRIKSYRRGKEFGTHRLTIKSPEEILILEHRALNRAVFSKGALRALLFIVNKPAGYYSVEELYAQKKLKPLF